MARKPQALELNDADTYVDEAPSRGAEVALLDLASPRQVTLAGHQFKIKKQVTQRVLKQEDGVTFFVQIVTSIYQGPDLPASKMEPPELVDVVNLETGEFMVLICNAVLKSSLEREYPDNSYKGLCFAVTRYAPINDEKRYKLYDIVEIEYA